MRAIIAFALVPCALIAQTPPAGDLLRLTREFRNAVEHDELTSAAELSEKLDAAVRDARNGWLTRDSQTRVDEVLSWLPTSIEGFWVNQTPFNVTIGDSPNTFQETPAILYSVDRLAAVGDGKFYRALSKRTVRMAMAATRGLTNSSDSMIPDVAKGQDVIYFYFLSEPVDFGPADESIENLPVWRALGSLTDWSAPFSPGEERRKKDDLNWVLMAQPDLLILSNRREVLAGVLQRKLHGSATRALPLSLPEWAEVDRNASLWGLCHYTERAKPKSGDWGFRNAVLPRPDGAAIGTAVRFDASSEQIEIHYLSPAPLAEGRPTDSLRSQFKFSQPRPGVSILTSSVRERGAYPMHMALSMLGFGEYR